MVRPKKFPGDETVVLSLRVRKGALDGCIRRWGNRDELVKRLVAAVEKYGTEGEARDASTARHPSAKAAPSTHGAAPATNIREVDPRWKTPAKK